MVPCMSYAYKKGPRTSVLIMLQSCEFKNSGNSDSDRKGLGASNFEGFVCWTKSVNSLDGGSNCLNQDLQDGRIYRIIGTRSACHMPTRKSIELLY